MTLCVLDASVALSWMFEDEDSHFAESVVGSLESDRAAVPAIWWLEVINAVLMAVRRGRIRERDASRFFTILDRLPLEIDQAAVREAPGQRIYEVAYQYDLSAYDASYLELAMRRGLPLATEDARLARAASAAGVGLLRR